ncbi:MAG: hypothetical protein AAFY52_01365 [Pseudomonadota bacterium]
MIITGTAGRVPERLAGLVYLDAFVPETSGFSLFAAGNPDRMARFKRQIDAGAAGQPPDMIDAWTDDPDLGDVLRARCTPHPAGCFANGVTLSGHERDIPGKMYIHCARNTGSGFGPEYHRVKNRPDWHSAEIDCSHDAMLKDPKTLATLLERFATPCPNVPIS